MNIKTGKYIHFTGNEYEFISTATHSETQEEMVVYRALYGNRDIWVRPYAMWVEMVHHNGQQIKRFTHEDDVAPVPHVPLDGIHNNSPPADKMKLFLSLFAGRGDVYAKRWEKNARNGYSPVCDNFWKLSCPKREKEKIKCGDCPTWDFPKYDARAVIKHLNGDLTVGVYPMFPDETCRFLVFDFDGKKDYEADILRNDVSLIRETCNEMCISMAMERSRSGSGIHFWIFFTENIPASVARRFGSSVITYTMKKHHKLSFKTYDRLIPTQDTFHKGAAGFGNLIALPFQKEPRENGNSVFVDELFNVYPDQWNYLDGIKKYSLKEVESFIRQLSPCGDLGDLHKDTGDEKPWEHPPSGKRMKQQALTNHDFPIVVKVVRSNMLYIAKAGISSPALNALKRLAAFRNPEFYKKQAMRKSTHDTERIISCSEETERYLCLPRGLEDEVRMLMDEAGSVVEFIDETYHGRNIDVVFEGELRSEQQPAADVLLSHDIGVLAATTAFGKTVIAAHLIASRKVNTLILVHLTSLTSHWRKQLSKFLVINEEPVVEYTPTGRKRKKSIIGQIGGGKNNLSGIIDIAVMQSLVTGTEVKDLVRNYGMVIVDECHHVAAFTFEQILKTANPKYVYGMTATPTRKDGHHPIIGMQCGKIRYRVDARKEAEGRPFEHYVIPRFTRFQKPMHRSEEYHFSDIYNDIQNSEVRNNLIIQDVVAAVEQGRNPIILSERKEHVNYLAEQLSESLPNVITLMGGGTQKVNREILESVANIPTDESFVLVATGKYVGEGFDMPRLDTLFLAMPISWKGTVQQYAGRLHRLYEGKKEVQIYDYVDVHVATLETMYQKRLKSYSTIGYKAKGTPQPLDEVHSIYDNHTFFTVYSADVLAARHEILIVSPFLSKKRILSATGYLVATSVKATVVTKPVDDYPDKDREKILNCMELLAQQDITIKTKERIHQKFAIIDQRIVWYGSINLMSYGNSEESIMRIDNVGIAAELLGSMNGIL
jgi:superfamily II DNA or RNA helicase